MKKIGIIGGGFTGTMTAVQLIRQSNIPLEIFIINEKETFNKGVAFQPYSDEHLLNVVAGKMSAFEDQPDHFVDWLMKKARYESEDKTILANSFLSRKRYGEYISELWNSQLPLAREKGMIIHVIEDVVVELKVHQHELTIQLGNDSELTVMQCVIATGNQLPRNPPIPDPDFYRSENYFQNPWQLQAVENTKKGLPVLIIGNGLTMVDTVLGLLEQGFKNNIVSISPNGFNILPHRHNGVSYSGLTDELKENSSLRDLVRLLNKHRKKVRKYGISAEAVIDSLRPYTQHIWKNLTDEEKSTFMSRLRHLWGVARHRIPVHTHDKIQRLRIEGKLQIQSGTIMELKASDAFILVKYMDRKEGQVKELKVSRIINCTGPETDLMYLENNFLKKCLLNGLILQDKLKLGIRTNTETFQVLHSNGLAHPNLFTLGPNLKGELWESTAVSELRVQAAELAKVLVGQESYAAQTRIKSY